MSLDEIPNTITISLGKRGFHPINPKKCIKCENENPMGLKLLEKIKHEEVSYEKGIKRIMDYKIQCILCDAIFFIRLQHIIHKEGEIEKRITTLVNILDENLNDLGWLGNY